MRVTETDNFFCRIGIYDEILFVFMLLFLSMLEEFVK